MGDFKVIFVPQARDDLRSIVTYIAAKSSSAVAEKLGISLIEKASSLTSFPERGRIVPEFKHPAVREIFFKSYRIVFRIHANTVQIIRFWHAARGTPEIDSDEFSQS